MSQDTKQFLQFIAATLFMAWAGGQIAGAGLPRSYALPFLVVWIALFLAVTGFIIMGKEGAKELLRSTGLTFGAILAIALLLLTLIGYWNS